MIGRPTPRLFLPRKPLRYLLLALMLVLCPLVSAGSFQGSIIVRGTDDGAGVSWLAVTINNLSSSPRDGTVVLESPSFYRREGLEGEIRIPFEKIPAGGSRVINVAVPFLPISTATVLEKGENPTNLNLDIQAFSSYGEGRKYLLVNTPETLLNETQLDAFTRAMGGGRSPYMGYGMPSSPATTATLTPLMVSERMITQAGIEELPENWQCYVPMKALFISEALEKQLSAGQARALDTWVNFGGEMVWYDSSTSATVSRGRGYITRRNTNPATDTSFTLQAQDSPFSLGPNLMAGEMPYTLRATGGQLVSFVLISLFMLVVGPLNYIYFSRRGQIRRLLKTVPAISLGFCVLIAGYFFLTEGFTRKGGSISITTVDEASNRAITFARHSMMSGLYPIGGFHFDRETYLRTGNTESGGNLQIILGKDTWLTRGLFKPKINFDYLTILPHGTRERILLDAGGTVARNGYELPLKAIAVLADGKYYRGGAAPSGGEVNLKPVQPTLSTEYTLRDRATSLKPALLIQTLTEGNVTRSEAEYLQAMIEALTYRDPGTSGPLYAVILDGTPPGVEAGVEITSGKNLHVVVGRPAPEGTP